MTEKRVNKLEADLLALKIDLSVFKSRSENFATKEYIKEYVKKHVREHVREYVVEYVLSQKNTTTMQPNFSLRALVLDVRAFIIKKRIILMVSLSVIVAMVLAAVEFLF